MSLSTGAQIGPYTIGDEIGSGGMGVVYRATDQNLKRDVAIKALPESFSTDADWVARFEREAQTLAALNHPNIAQIYGLERADGVTALVMELVEGPTLADRIADGPLPPDEALGVAMQVADALEAAHGQGIVHRDLKPANIKLRSDGTVKVLDFGIAKTLDIRAASGQPAAMTTPAMTQTGIILGTAAYMSPEQARGRPIDQRTDIWAFGCLLYEMLTGQPAFAGEDVAITLARILANETNMKSLSGVVTPAVRHTIELCLQKDERKRIADIRDVRLALQGIFDKFPSENVVEASARRPLWRRLAPTVATGVTVVLLTGLAVWFVLRPEPPQVTRFDYGLPAGQTLRSPGWPLLSISPDGRHFVYNTVDGLYLRRMDQLDAQLIAGTEPDLDNPVFSPDGQSVAYWDESNQLKRISISGGASVPLADIGGLRGISWQGDGTILYAQEDGIRRVSADGGAQPDIIVPMLQDDYNYGAQLLPDGDAVLFSLGGTPNWDEARVVAQSISTGERTVIIEGGNDARYLPTGHIIYAFGDTLFAVAFDPDTLTVSGGAIPVVQGVLRSTTGQTGVAHYDVSSNGTLVYLSGDFAATARTLVWVDRDGNEEPISAEPRNYATPRISPDGTKALVNARDRDQDIWVWEFARETLTRLTFDRGQDRFPVWSIDGLRVAYHSQPEGGDAVFWRVADGTGPAEQLVEGNQIWPTAFLPDGSGLLVYGAFAGTITNDDIGILWLDEDRSVEPLLNSMYAEVMPDVSPDGRWLAYSSNESGANEVFVRSFPDVEGGGRWQISRNGGEQPLWSHDGRELFYRNGDAMMVVQVETEPTFMPGNPTVLFEGTYSRTLGGRTYDVSPDGERFLLMKDVDSSSSNLRFVVVENWLEELRRLAPTR